MYYAFIPSASLTKAVSFGLLKRWRFCLLFLYSVATPVELLTLYAKIVVPVPDLWHQHQHLTKMTKVSEIKVYTLRFRCSFISQGTSSRRQRRDLFGLQVKLPPVTTSLTTQRYRGNPVKCLAQGYNKRTFRPIFTHPFIILNVKQGSCEYQLLKCFGKFCLSHFLYYLLEFSWNCYFEKICFRKLAIFSDEGSPRRKLN